MKVPANVVDQLVNGVQSDIRQVLNMLSTWRLSNSSLDFDQSKTLLVFSDVSSLSLLTDMSCRAKMNEKYSVMTPFNVTQKILGPYMFSPTARETLSDKMELYFHDYSFVPLFIQVRLFLFHPSRHPTSKRSSVTIGKLLENTTCACPEREWASASPETLVAYGSSLEFNIRRRSCRCSDSWVSLSRSMPSMSRKMLIFIVLSNIGL